MKILHVSTAHTWRGGEQQIVNLVEGLMVLKKPVEQKIFCASNGELSKYCANKKIPFSTARKKGSISPPFIRGLKQTLKSFNPDIIHVHDSHAHTATFLAHKLVRSKTPIVLHRRVDFSIAQSFLSKRKYNYPFIKRIICVSAAIEKVVKQSIQQATVVILSSNRKERVQKYSRTNILRKEYGWDTSAVLIGNIAALADHKDYPTFVRAAKLIHDKHPEYRFIIMGEGSERPKIEALIAEYKLNDVVKLTGFRSDIPKAIHDLDVFMMSSKMEGLGSTLFDVFAAKIPIVATNGGGVGELVKNDVSGVLCEVGSEQQLADGVDKVTNDKDFAQQIIDGGLQILEENQYTSMASKTYEVYQSILE